MLIGDPVKNRMCLLNIQDLKNHVLLIVTRLIGFWEQGRDMYVIRPIFKLFFPKVVYTVHIVSKS